jgi:hypothetical protein
MKPNQTKSNLPGPRIGLPVAKVGGGIRPGQTQSKPVKPEKEV